ncbi:acetyl-CoA carboxylase biotin carboxyl carrier protein [Blautia sp. Sow4_E7]|uniref:acetyl-CoA carboxylase biotin carboxyl carrier protein n=1 Tax=Blautia sp. Sow4_E7 TaxID=3438749 RepID=UPI003F9015D6
MEFEQILKLVDHVSASHLESFCYEGDGLKLTLNNKIAPVIVPGMMQNSAVFGTETVKNSTVSPTSETVPNSTVPSSAKTVQNTAAPSSTEEPEGNIVKSPLVGTFYAAPSEDAPAFVKTGDKVKKGQVLAIVEAMKLMNEIESDFDGEVAEILVENGQPVEYGQPLFVVR